MDRTGSCCDGHLPKYPHPNTDSVGDGLNYRGFTFSSPLPQKLDVYVAKLDYTLTRNGNHRLFARVYWTAIAPLWLPIPHQLTGDGGSQFPGSSAANRTLVNTSKGLSVGYTATLSNTLITTSGSGISGKAPLTKGLQCSTLSISAAWMISRRKPLPRTTPYQ